MRRRTFAIGAGAMLLSWPPTPGKIQSRDGLKDIFGKWISRSLIGRPLACGLIGTRSNSPRHGGNLHIHDDRAVAGRVRSGVVQ